MHNYLKHYLQIPKDLTMITDINIIYNVDQLFFKTHGIKFDFRQSIGVKKIKNLKKLDCTNK